MPLLTPSFRHNATRRVRPSSFLKLDTAKRGGYVPPRPFVFDTTQRGGYAPPRPLNSAWKNEEGMSLLLPSFSTQCNATRRVQPSSSLWSKQCHTTRRACPSSL